MTMEIACHAWAFNDRSVEDALGTVARLGFRNVDLGNGPHFDLNEAAHNPGREADRLRDVLDYYELHLTDLYISLPYINDPDPKRREEQQALFERLLPFALALGTPGITISPGIQHPDGEDHSLARSIPALLHIAQAAEDTDLRFSFEAHLDSSVTKPDQVLLLVEAIPGLSLTLDYAHFIAQGFALNEITPLLPHTAHVHIRQAVKGRLQTPFQQGRIELNELMRDLQDADYHGALSIEYTDTVGWHGMMPVNITQETVKTRDALRELRDTYER